VVDLTVEPQNLNSEVMFENHIKGGAIPLKFIPAIEEGVKEAAEAGLYGYSLTGVKVVLKDGSFHEVDSSEMAFKMAGSIAFREAVKKAGVKLLEPVMKMVLTTPEEYLGNIISDLKSRRADIQNIELEKDLRILHSLIPLGETFGYINVLRSLSSGRASFFLEFHRYCEVPSFLIQEIISERK
jgi:elongation factor G